MRAPAPGLSWPRSGVTTRPMIGYRPADWPRSGRSDWARAAVGEAPAARQSAITPGHVHRPATGRIHPPTVARGPCMAILLSGARPSSRDGVVRPFARTCAIHVLTLPALPRRRGWARRPGPGRGVQSARAQSHRGRAGRRAPVPGAESMIATAQITQLLEEARRGDAAATDQLVPLLYAELRRMAAGLMARERGATLQPTALVHEAYLRLLGDGGAWQGRAHFLGAAARAMRRILIERARGRGRLKRRRGPRAGHADRRRPAVPPRARKTCWPSTPPSTSCRPGTPRMARVVELRYFGGLTVTRDGRGPGHVGAQRPPAVGGRPGLAAPGVGRGCRCLTRPGSACGACSTRRASCRRPAGPRSSMPSAATRTCAARWPRSWPPTSGLPVHWTARRRRWPPWRRRPPIPSWAGAWARTSSAGRSAKGGWASSTTPSRSPRSGGAWPSR